METRVISKKELCTLAKGLREEGKSWEEVTTAIRNKGFRLQNGMPSTSNLCTMAVKEYPSLRTRTHTKKKQTKKDDSVVEMRLAEQIMTATNLTEQERVQMMRRIFSN